MGAPFELSALIDRLSPDQRAAATAAPGPVLCVAPAGSGKTTTLVARIGWRIHRGVDPATVCAITFNARAAEELRDRVGPVLAAMGVDPASVEIRTFHALGRAILESAGLPVEPLIERRALLRACFPGIPPPELRRLDDAISRLKLDAMVGVPDVASDPDPGPIGLAFLAYERARAEAGGIDFDDLVAEALRALRSDDELARRWRLRCGELFVDEVQDVDRSQLALALHLAEPGNRIFLVGDDDQTIYGWRLADVRRVIGLAATLPGLRRVDLVTNRRCPSVVVDRAARLIAHNRERFAKQIRARPGAEGRLNLAPDPGDDAARARHVLDSWPADGSTRAFLARTNHELLPALGVLLEHQIAFRAAGLPTPLESPHIDRILSVASARDAHLPLLVRLVGARVGELEGEPASGSASEPSDETEPDEAAAALVAWAARYPTLEALTAAIVRARRLLDRLRRDHADLTLATVHSTKGLEFDHVAVLGMDAGRFPSARSVTEAPDPARALEEERRLAYVAWTRARRSLTLVFDPSSPSPFLLEAFDELELGTAEAA
jgi:superfamily I DNA/RNA helicase